MHFLVSIPPQVTISRLLQWLKGKTAHHLMPEFAHTKKQFWAPRLWILLLQSLRMLREEIGDEKCVSITRNSLLTNPPIVTINFSSSATYGSDSSVVDIQVISVDAKKRNWSPLSRILEPAGIDAARQRFRRWLNGDSCGAAHPCVSTKSKMIDYAGWDSDRQYRKLTPLR